MPAGPPPAITHVVESALAGTRQFWHVGRVAGFLNWWDGVELWLSGLGFVLQTIVVIPVALALAFGLAVLLDGALGRAIGILRRVRHGEAGER